MIRLDDDEDDDESPASLELDDELAELESNRLDDDEAEDEDEDGFGFKLVAPAFGAPGNGSSRKTVESVTLRDVPKKRVRY